MPIDEDMSMIPGCCEKHRREGMVGFATAIIAKATEKVASLEIPAEDADEYCTQIRILSDQASINYFIASRLRGCDLDSGRVDDPFPSTVVNSDPDIASDNHSDMESD